MRRKYENNDSNRQKIKKSSLSAKITSRIDHWKQTKQNELVIENMIEEIAITTSHGDFILTPLKGMYITVVSLFVNFYKKIGLPVTHP
jgi:hypothetical protein